MFGEKLPSLFRVVKNNRSFLRLEDDNDFEEQRAIKQARVQKDNADYLSSIHEQKKDTLANHVLHRIKNKDELVIILGTIQSETKQVEFLMYQLRIILIGYSLENVGEKIGQRKAIDIKVRLWSLLNAL
jgi:hypothetical protein